MSYRNLLSVLLALGSLVCADRAAAIIQYATAARNTTAPTGALSGSGWQWQGRFGDFIAIPISKKYFITASHIGGTVGSRLRYSGTSYFATEYYDDPQTDLRIYKSHKSFTTWAPLFTGTGEPGNAAMLFGRGVPRGNEIIKNTRLKGWEWGTFDGATSWGQNRIEQVINYGGDLGELLTWNFNRSGGVFGEGILSGYDSGGGVFIQTAAGWKLAGINYSVDGNYSRTATGTQFNAALFDKGGLYEDGEYVLDTTADKPATSYATRISGRMSWIQQVFNAQIAPTAPGSATGGVGVPEPGSIGGMLALLIPCCRRHRTRSV